jgi:hypothetical protein
MNPTLNSGPKGFSSTSINNINGYLSSQACLSTVGGEGGGEGSGDFFEIKSALSTSTQEWCFDLSNSDTSNFSPIHLLDYLRSNPVIDKGLFYFSSIIFNCHFGENQVWTFQR